MKRGEGKFADRMRDRLARGTDAAKRMIDRVRELVEPEPGARPARHESARKPSDERKSVHHSAREADMEILPEFATATMGGILFNQGRFGEALVVYERLLARNPQHAEARRGVARCREAMAGSTETEAASEPTEMLDRAAPPNGYDVAETRALPVDPGSIAVFWELTDEALQAAGTDIGWGAVRSLRVVSIVEGGGHREERFVEEIPSHGNFFVRELPTGATHFISVGLHRGEHFVAIATSEPVETPRGAPGDQVARVRATVAVPSDRAQPARIVRVVGPSPVVQQMASHTHTRALLDAPEHVDTPVEIRPVPSEPVRERAGETPGEAPREVPASWPSSGQWASSGQWLSSWRGGAHS